MRAAPLGLACLALLPGLARADVADHEFSPYHLQQLVGLDDFSYDSDWFPMAAPLQLRLIAHAGNSVEIDMPGRGSFDWDAHELWFTGDPGAGRFDIDIGLELNAKVRFDVLGLQWESDILGPYDYAVISGQDFTPYLLPGNPERPVQIDDETDPVTFVSVPVVPDILVAAGNLDIDAYVIVGADLACTQIEATALEPQTQHAIVIAEGAKEPLDPGPGPQPDPFTASGVLVCDLATTPTIVLKPTLVMEILGQEFEVANIEIPIVLPAFDDTVRFDAQPLSFPRPPAPADPTTGPDSEGDADGATGWQTTGEAPTTTAADDPSSTTGDDTTTTDDAATDASSGSAGELDDEGCGCRSPSRGAPLLLALPLLALTRRRRSAARPR